MASNNEEQSRAVFCEQLSTLLNVYIFNEEITTQMTLDASKSAEEINKTFDDLVNENKMLKAQIKYIVEQSSKIRNGKYFQRHIKTDGDENRKRQHKSIAEKSKDKNYMCCDICDRWILKSGKREHIMTDVCLSIRVSKEIAKKSHKNILCKKRKIDLIVANRNLLIMLINKPKKLKEKDEKEQAGNKIRKWFKGL